MELEITHIDPEGGPTPKTWKVFAGKEGCGQFFIVRANRVNLGDTLYVSGEFYLEMHDIRADSSNPLVIVGPKNAIPRKKGPKPVRRPQLAIVA